MATRVSPATVLAQAHDLQRMAVSEERAVELAAELNQILGTVSAAALALEVEDDPTGFLSTLNTAADQRGRR